MLVESLNYHSFGQKHPGFWSFHLVSISNVPILLTVEAGLTATITDPARYVRQETVREAGSCPC